MSELALHAAPARARGRELDPARTLPYARHVNDRVIALDTGALMISFRFDGASFETADVRDLNDWHAKLNGAWRNLASDRLAVWHHLVRRTSPPPAPGAFRSDFARGLDAAYRARLGRERLFVNDLFVTLVLHPGREATERTQAWVGRLLRANRVDLETEDATSPSTWRDTAPSPSASTRPVAWSSQRPWRCCNSS
jgi:type IV secretion system protein VirB4